MEMYDGIALTCPKKNCIFSATTKSLEGMLIGRFLVGTGMGVGPPVASLYVTEVPELLFLVVYRVLSPFI